MPKKKVRHCVAAGQLFLKLARAGGQLELFPPRWIRAADTLAGMTKAKGWDLAVTHLSNMLLGRRVTMAQECFHGRYGERTSSCIVPPGWPEQVHNALCEGNPLESFPEEEQKRYYLTIAETIVAVLANPGLVPELDEFLCGFYFGPERPGRVWL